MNKKGQNKMKIIDFKTKEKSYCLEKLDIHNFSLREYLNEPKKSIFKGKEFISEFKQSDNFFGTLEYALKKAFKILGKDLYSFDIKSSIYTIPTLNKSIFELTPNELEENNLDEVKMILKKLFN
jgi:hypothetical protein